MEEARAYQNNLNKVLEEFLALLEEDQKNALCVMIQSWKRIMSRAWSIMVQADVDMVLKSIADPACIILKQTLNPGGIESVDPPEDQAFFSEHFFQWDTTSCEDCLTRKGNRRFGSASWACLTTCLWCICT